MRRILFIVLFFFLAFLESPCYAQDAYSWDFGRVKEGAVLKHIFKLSNDSGRSLNIKEATTSCGCTVSKVGKKRLRPAESTVIEVSFKTKGYSGLTQQYVYVHTDDLDNPLIRFIIKAEVVK